MKKLLYTVVLALAAIAVSCADDDYKDYWETYADWRNGNITWLEQQQSRTNPDGTPYYETVIPNWDKGSFVLVHRFGPSHTENLTPLSTSTVDVIYKGFNYEGERFDSSTTVTAYGRPGVARFQLNGVIKGWTAAFETLHVGDSAEIICPYNMAYGESYVSEQIKPYSVLRFNVRLVDIFAYEK
ncbi:MAG: FKBP-type peptidyl-prolyl cis-trans isomerase [Muribaculaceae bacterium]|nr:FKBP-type peptidyl-prolyl cis-trans isomerase [Muribaculaceae bacterium]